jgi:protocatechuate 3,4-dioxygenase beta subunit
MQTKSKLLALAALVLLGGLVALRFERSEGQSAEATAPEAAQPNRETRPVPEEAADKSSDDATPRVAVAVEQISAADAAARPSGIEILAVVGAERRLVENAELWWLKGSFERGQWYDPTFEEWLNAGVLEQRMVDRAVRIERDADGKLRLPKPAQQGAVVASAEGLWAMATIPWDSTDPTYVTLEPDITLTARVVDLAGQPVQGVRVALRECARDDETFDFAVAETDASGLALFRHYRRLLDCRPTSIDGLSFSIAEPLLEPVRVEFDPTAPPTEVVTLVLPPTGSVVLRLGERSTVRRAQLELRRSDVVAEREWQQRRHFEGERDALNGTVRFSFVGLGGSVVPQTSQGNRSRAHDVARTAGPSRAGEEVQIQLALPRVSIEVSGRALDESGAPIADARCRVFFESGDLEFVRIGETAFNQTDADGRFVLKLDRGAKGASTLKFEWLTDGSVTAGEGAVSFDWPEGAERHDAGDVRVERLPIVVAGQVVDRNGRALAGADISAWIGTQERQVEHNDFIFKSSARWVNERNLRARSDKHGQFVVYGAMPSAELLLEAASDGANSPPTPVRLGDRNVTLVASHDGVLRGRVLFDESFSSDAIRVEAELEGAYDGTLPPERLERLTVDAEGRFLFRGIQAGPYTVSIHVGARSPAAVFEGVRVESGSDLVDPRLDPLDLRKLGRWRTVRVLEPDGSPSRDWVLARPDPDEAGGLAFDRRAGPRLCFEEKETELSLCTSKSLIERIDPAALGDTIRLNAAPSVRLVVTPGCPWPEDAYLFVTVCGANDDAAFEAKFDQTELDLEPDVPLELFGRRLGPLQVKLGVLVNEAAELPCEIVRGGVLAATSGVHVLEIRWTQEALDKALAEARE